MGEIKSAFDCVTIKKIQSNFISLIPVRILTLKKIDLRKFGKELAELKTKLS